MPEPPDGASGTPAATAGRREDPSQGTKPTAMVAGNPRVGGALSAEPAEVEPRKMGVKIGGQRGSEGSRDGSLRARNRCPISVLDRVRPRDSNPEPAD
jgi:hypothetical protein